VGEVVLRVGGGGKGESWGIDWGGGDGGQLFSCYICGEETRETLAHIYTKGGCCTASRRSLEPEPTRQYLGSVARGRCRQSRRLNPFQ
jgi:hypothetical protein